MPESPIETPAVSISAVEKRIESGRRDIIQKLRSGGKGTLLANDMKAVATDSLGLIETHLDTARAADPQAAFVVAKRLVGVVEAVASDRRLMEGLRGSIRPLLDYAMEDTRYPRNVRVPVTLDLDRQVLGNRILRAVSGTALDKEVGADQLCHVHDRLQRRAGQETGPVYDGLAAFDPGPMVESRRSQPWSDLLADFVDISDAMPKWRAIRLRPPRAPGAEALTEDTAPAPYQYSPPPPPPKPVQFTKVRRGSSLPKEASSLARLTRHIEHGYDDPVAEAALGFDGMPLQPMLTVRNVTQAVRAIEAESDREKANPAFRSLVNLAGKKLVTASPTKRYLAEYAEWAAIEAPGGTLPALKAALASSPSMLMAVGNGMKQAEIKTSPEQAPARPVSHRPSEKLRKAAKAVAAVPAPKAKQPTTTRKPKPVEDERNYGAYIKRLEAVPAGPERDKLCDGRLMRPAVAAIFDHAAQKPETAFPAMRKLVELAGRNIANAGLNQTKVSAYTRFAIWKKWPDAVPRLTAALGSASRLADAVDASARIAKRKLPTGAKKAIKDMLRSAGQAPKPIPRVH